MTNARKLEILEAARALLNSLNANEIECTICICINYKLTQDEKDISRYARYYFGDILLRHKPKYRDVSDLWFDLTQEGKEKRLSILDTMIAEYKEKKYAKQRRHKNL